MSLQHALRFSTGIWEGQGSDLKCLSLYFARSYQQSSTQRRLNGPAGLSVMIIEWRSLFRGLHLLNMQAVVKTRALLTQMRQQTQKIIVKKKRMRRKGCRGTSLRRRPRGAIHPSWTCRDLTCTENRHTCLGFGNGLSRITSSLHPSL